MFPPSAEVKPRAAGGWEADYALGSSDEDAALAAAAAEGRAPVKRVRLTDLYNDSRGSTDPLQPQVCPVTRLP